MKNFKVNLITVFSILFLTLSAGAQASIGTLTVRGEAGPSQIFRQVKVAKCSSAIRSCSNVEYFDLNQKKNIIWTGIAKNQNSSSEDGI